MTEPTEAQLERIADAFWNRESTDALTIIDICTHDACNHTMTGIIDSIKFIVESGDRNGTVVHAWGDPEEIDDFKHPEPIRRTFVPEHELPPAMQSIYEQWRTQAWFTDAERSMNYDYHFAPGVVTEKHYREFAAKRGLVVRIVNAD